MQIPIRRGEESYKYDPLVKNVQVNHQARCACRIVDHAVEHSCPHDLFVHVLTGPFSLTLPFQISSVFSCILLVHVTWVSCCILYS